jgi:hypothetical protein
MDVFEHNHANGEFVDWTQKYFKEFFPNFSNNLSISSEIVYQKLESFDNYKDKTLLLVGGGPSSNYIDLNKVHYDYLWSMNQFYLNKKLNKKKIDLVMIMGETKLDKIKIYRDMYCPKIGFEIHSRWKNYNFDNYPNYFCMHTRFYGKIGIGARMLIFAAALGFKNVMFCGLDGPESILKGDHSFEPGKTTLPSCFINQDLSTIANEFKYQYDFLWLYIHKVYPSTKFYNLGYKSIYHEKC